jgi:hemerythrin-like domain-containing protein
MKATDILMSEHLVIERVIAALETAAASLENGVDVRPGFFLDAADFIKDFADGCHHKKEEGVLFVAMSESGVPVQGGPIGAMLYEHDQGRMYTRRLREAAAKLTDNPSAREAVIENSLGYTALLRQHIMKENRVLFPMAERFIPPAKQAAVAEDFERVEHEETGNGIHEKYLTLADALTAEAAQLLTEV